MRLSFRKLKWKMKMKKPYVGADTFCPSPSLVFYILSCRKCLLAWRNVSHLLSCKVTVVQGYRTGSVLLGSIPTVHTLSFLHWVNPEMSSGMEECKIPAWARDKMFPSPDRSVRRHTVMGAEFCIRSCYSVRHKQRTWTHKWQYKACFLNSFVFSAH